MTKKRRHPPKPNHTPASKDNEAGKPWSRRKFLTVLGVSGAGAAATYLGYQALNTTEEKEDTPLSEEGEYITLEKAASLYNDYYKIVSEKYAKAKEEGKPFRILIGEQHDQETATALEMLLLCIAKTVGIQDVLFEFPPESMKHLIHYVQTGDGTLAWDTKLLADIIRKNNMVPYGTDDLFPSFEAGVNDVSLRIKDVANQRFAKEFAFGPSQQLVTDVTYKDGDTFHIEYDDVLMSSLTESQKLRIEELRDEISNQAMIDFAAQRDKNITKNINRFKQAIGIVGAMHLKPVLESARNGNGKDAAFLFLGEGDQAESLKEQPNIQWLKQPSNAVISYDGKEFELENLSIFIESAIKLANRKYKTPMPAALTEARTR